MLTCPTLQNNCGPESVHPLRVLSVEVSQPKDHTSGGLRYGLWADSPQRMELAGDARFQAHNCFVKWAGKYVLQQVE